MTNKEEFQISELKSKSGIKRIVDINREAWISTFINETIGVTKEIIETRYQDGNRVKAWSEDFEKQRFQYHVAIISNSIVGYTMLEKHEISRKEVCWCYV